MKQIELRKGIYYVGVVDWSVRNFHGYTTNRGATYNAYLIVDEKIALIDTVKGPFAKELLERVRQIVDPTKIDYLISNHVEPDHSGSLPEILEAASNAVVVTSAPSGVEGLKAYYGVHEYLPVKAGDSISLGKRSLTFVATPMLHWPDNMVTYCPEEQILFSNDAFGQHYATSDHFDDEVDLSEAFHEAKKYYANILMLYGKQASKAIEIVRNLKLDMIAPSHGVIWRSHVREILDCYEEWAHGIQKDKAVVVFDSMWHSTEKMARHILEGFAKAEVEVKLFDLKVCHISDIMTDVLDAKYIAIGSPTLNNQVMPTVASFLAYLKGLAPAGKFGFVFGSYGWNGLSIKILALALAEMKIEAMFEPWKIVYLPGEEELNGFEDKIRDWVLTHRENG